MPGVETTATVRDAMEDAVLYAKQHACEDLLREYVIRVLRARPADPIQFLMDEIKSNPFRPPSAATSFVRDPAEDGEALVHELRRGGPRLFFRQPLTQAQCRSRLAGIEAPTVVAHGSLHTGQVVRTAAEGIRLALPTEQDAGPIPAAQPGSAPYCADVVAALVSIELDRRAAAAASTSKTTSSSSSDVAAGKPSPADRNAMQRFAPHFLTGYVRGLTSGQTRAVDMEPAFPVPPPFGPGAGAAMTGRSLLQNSPLVALMRQKPLDSTEPAVAAAAGLYPEAGFVEAGALPGGRVLVALAAGTDVTIVEVQPIGASLEVLSHVARCYGSPEPRFLTANDGASYVAVQVDPSLERYDKVLDGDDAVAQLALWFGAALGCAHGAQGPAVAVDAIRRDAASRVDEWIALASDIANEVTVAHEVYLAASAAK